MDNFFHRELFQNESEFTEYLNLYFITALAVILYILYGIVFLLFAGNKYLLMAQAFFVSTSAVAFVVNRARHTRAASIMMIALVCMSINIWAYMVDVGIAMRWYAILAIFPLYFFSILKKRDKIVLTGFILAAFLSASAICYYHEPMMRMPMAEMYNTASSFVVIISIALELLLYRYINTKRDNELTRVGTILDNIECGIVIVDAETHEIMDINPVAERMYEGSKEAVVKEKCHLLICPAEEGKCPITDKAEEVHRSERVLLKANGDRVPIIKSVAKIWYKGRPALLESFTDITDLKEAEEKLRVLEITEQANRAKSDFLSRMSHEMRTPMNAIIGMAKIAEGTDDISRLKYCLSMIDLSSSHLLGIINDILDMSKIESGKLELDSAPLNIEKILLKVKGIMLGQAERKGIALDISVGDGVEALYMGDGLRLTQVITNLISNAVKFTPEGGTVKVTVEELQKEEDFSIVRFAVADTGIGIEEEHRDKLFSAFEQADGSITRKYGGTGLGLAISKSIVEKMDGKIWVESEPGKGSTFTFDIRLEHADTQDAYDGGEYGDLPSIPYEEGTLPDFTGAVLLLAEDVEINREIFISLLGDTHIEIDTAENGQEAVQKFRDAPSRYSVIIMDIQMPVMNGYEATEAIRALDIDEAGSVPIIAMSADAFKEDIDRCLACGMNGHLKKPIELEKVIETLSIYCKATS